MKIALVCAILCLAHTTHAVPKFVDGIKSAFYQIYPRKGGNLNGECSNDSNENCSNPSESYQFEDSSSLNLIDGLDQDYIQSTDYEDVAPIAHNSDSTLRQVLILHRHGDRTPIQFPSKDTIGDEPFWTFHGLGQLTNRGKARLFLLGKIMRGRYNKFLGESVNKNNRISRSSGSLRCIESAQTFLSSFLGLNVNGSSDANSLHWGQNELAHLWQPANVQNVPAEIDGMLAESAQCNVLTDEYDSLEKIEAVSQLYEEYSNEIRILNDVYGFLIDRFYKFFWASSQIEVEKSYFPDKMKPEILSIYGRLVEAGHKALDIYQSTTKAKRLRSGLLIKNFIDNMKEMRDETVSSSDNISKQAKKFVHYSAHDLTLVVLLGMLDSWNDFPIRPNYASNIVVELHQDQSDWFVKIFYMNKVPGLQVEISFDTCTIDHPRGLCTLDKFEELMKPYSIDDWQTWMTECDNDMKLIDPYKIGH